MFKHRGAWVGFLLPVVFFVIFFNGMFSKLNVEVPPLQIQGTELSWSLDGTWTGVVCDENNGAIYAVGTQGKCVELDIAGNTIKQIQLPEDSGETIRLCDLPGTEGPLLLTFSRWKQELRAHDQSGNQLWNYPAPTGMDDVWAYDLNNDNSDEVIVGFNGDGGLHVLDSKGQLQWKSLAIGNVWHVCAGDVWGKSTPQVVTTSAGGDVHIFSSDGKKRKDYDGGLYASMVRIGKISENDRTETIFVAGSSLTLLGNNDAEILTAISSNGKNIWAIGLPTDFYMPNVISASLANGKPWLAVSMLGGVVHVVDTQKGEIIASVDNQGRSPDICWTNSKEDESPLLFVTTGSKLNAFRIIGK